MENERKLVSNTGVNGFLTKMYGFMAGAVAISAVVAYLVSNVFYNEVATYMSGHPFMMFILFGLQLLIAVGMSFKADRSPVVSGLGLVAFATIQGVFFGIIVSLYAASDVTMAFVGAAAVFVSMAVMGTTTKKDLSRIGTHALAALIALVIVSVVNMFLQSTMITFVFSFAGVIIFTALTAWDAQKFRTLYLQTRGQVSGTGLALMGALQLYLDFVNLFISLLNIFTGFNNK
ncbi:Bax inhibitor-1/YccA family protein [Lactobacillus sp. UCMA15818]|uniref:Bax inhibitor-1/YccA family protein n=1 Tax=Lactobacillaceae TaxID=33958 RepID=UPI0025B1F714|nr:Bax inhibitor-1/YccA family protein [Lactobacillus sp. UCMA15818]MDN2452640.1 Bax inhibitor-1/YccA family protein [Lactobacillus sp. UCMA15818]